MGEVIGMSTVENTRKPRGMVRCPVCKGTGESEHWTTCETCLEYVEDDPRMDTLDVWDTYCPWHVASLYYAPRVLGALVCVGVGVFISQRWM